MIKLSPRAAFANSFYDRVGEGASLGDHWSLVGASFSPFAMAGRTGTQVAVTPSAIEAPVSLSGATYSQNFDALSNTAGSTTNNFNNDPQPLPGWSLNETGGSAARDNEQYAVDTGGSNTGDTFSYGAAGNGERALGALQSGTLISTFGASFTNDTGGTITSLLVGYTGEQWRIGNTAAARDDRLDFQISFDATSLTTGSWSDVNQLDFVNIIKTAAAAGALDGNDAANRTAISFSITSLSIANGATFWIRWVDFNASGADDGLAIDDFSVTANSAPALPILSINDVTLTEGDSGTVTYTFTVSLSAPAGPGGVTFDISTADGTAQDGNPGSEDNDYVARSLTGQTIPAGSSTYTFDVTVNGDALVEPNETFFVNVTNVTGATVGDGQGQGTINNNDIAPAPGTLSIGDVTLAEGNAGTTAFTFTVTRSGGSSGAVSATWTLNAPGGAGNADSADFDAGQLGTGTASFLDGETSRTITILVAGDTVFEPDEAFTVTLSAPTGGATLGDASGAGTITNDDASAVPVVSIDDASVVEIDSGNNYLVVTVRLSSPATNVVSVNFDTAPGTATVGADYVPTSGQVVFQIGEDTKTIEIPVFGDHTVEPDEALTITLSSPSGATLGDATATGTILNDDVLAPALPWINEFHYDNGGTDTGEFIEIAGIAGTNLTGYSLVLYNGNGGASYNTLALSGVIPDQGNGIGTLSFAYAGIIQNGSPDGIALVGPGGVVEFISYEGVMTAVGGPAGGLTSTDVGVEEPGDANGTSIGRVGTGNQASDFTWALIGDDTPGGPNAGQTFTAALPQVTISDVVLNETDGFAFYTITVTRSGATGAFSLDYSTANGTAIAGIDYQATSGTLNFGANDVGATINLTLIGDDTAELDETFFINLFNASGAEIVDAQGTITIDNDDGDPPIVSINDVSIVEGDAGTSILTFTVTRTGDSSAFTVDFETVGISATEGVDFVDTNGTLSFGVGENSREIQIFINGDMDSESSETFEVRLSNPSGTAAILDGTGIGTIVNDESTFIHDIQGTAYFSPILAGEGITAFNVASTAFVTVRAVVTAVDNVGNKQGFYIQEEITDWDGNKYTSEGIFVMTRDDDLAGMPVSGVAVGDLVTVTARVMEYRDTSFQNMPITALVNASFVVNSTGNGLPAFFLDTGHPIPNSIMTSVTPDYTDSSDGAGDTFDAALFGLSYWETVEGMLVTIPDLVVADGFVGSSSGRPFLQAYSTVHADADQINSRGGYTIAGDPPNSPPDTPETDDGTTNGGRVLHDGDVNPDIIEVDWTGFAAAPPAGLAAGASMGDLLGDVTGIIEFDFTDRKLFVTSMEPGGFVDNGSPVQETTTFGGDDRSLTVATFNVENLDPGDGAARFTALANAIANNLNSPDIICIEEMQDNNGATDDGTTDASTTWQMLVNALNAATGKVYQWVDQEPVDGDEGGEPGGNIRVGFLYDTGRVQLGNLDANASLADRRKFTDRIGDDERDTGDLIAFDDSMLGSEINTADWTTTRNSLLGEFNFHGNAVYVTANHWPAKGGSGNFWQFDQNLGSGQPDNSDWAQRNAIANDVYSMLNLIQSTNANAGIVAGGDFNDFYFYRPLEVLTGYVLPDGSARPGGARFDNLTLTLAEAERYTYTFDGRSQAIDHIIANQLLSAVATYDVVHLNTGYNPSGSPALSDHDPGISTFDYRNFGEVLVGTSGNDAIAGLGGDDNISTGQGSDILNGGTGIDTLSGGADNDLYFVDRAEDIVVEAAGGGDDRVGASASYALAAGVSVETLVANPDSLTTPINLSGNEFGQTIVGNQGNNVILGFAGGDQLVGLGGNDILVGGFGADVLRGGLGNDIYGIDEQDQLFENGGEGDDTAAVSATASSYHLNAGTSIETLSTANQASTAAQNLTGNELGQSLFGSEGSNVLNGAGGNDLLMGYGGADIFLFNTALGAGNVDVIADLVHGTDRIALDNAVFTGLQEGNLGAGAFVVGSAALDADDRIIYDQGTGQLFFDADGNGAGGAVLFATLNGNPTLTVSDFLVI